MGKRFEHIIKIDSTWEKLTKMERIIKFLPAFRTMIRKKDIPVKAEVVERCYGRDCKFVPMFKLVQSYYTLTLSNS